MILQIEVGETLSQLRSVLPFSLEELCNQCIITVPAFLAAWLEAHMINHELLD